MATARGDVAEPKTVSADDNDLDDIHQMQFKVILLGDGAVGKTSIARRFSENQFNQMYKQTVGVDFFIRRINIPPNYHITLQLWDIGGQSIGSRMITNYISGAHAVLLCYDITNYESFANLEDWYGLVLKTFENKQLPYTALIGNKFDLRHLTAVRIEQHNQFAEENEMASYLMSAKSGDQVHQCFNKVACTLAKIPLKAENDISTSVVTATIVDHQRHDESVNDGVVPEYTKTRNVCILS